MACWICGTDLFPAEVVLCKDPSPEGQVFHIKNGMYPQNLQMLVMDPTGGGGYLDSDVVPADPWDNEYLYVSDGQNFRIWSMGGDGRDQGGEGDDIIGK